MIREALKEWFLPGRLSPGGLVSPAFALYDVHRYFLGNVWYQGDGRLTFYAIPCSGKQYSWDIGDPSFDISALVAVATEVSRAVYNNPNIYPSSFRW